MVPCGDGAMPHCQQGTRIKWIQHSCPGTLSIAASYLFRVTVTPGTVMATLCTLHTASSGQVRAPLSLQDAPLVWTFVLYSKMLRCRRKKIYSSVCLDFNNPFRAFQNDQLGSSNLNFKNYRYCSRAVKRLYM